ncbi:MAG TPA: BTAD domain-containing putative transcriptional regulator, partial [Thermodesulfobacteriota bacterium]|nr:BTAD domain-containing putative transcriptional regulator [Thermodesulfobacteriota bacterium]
CERKGDLESGVRYFLKAQNHARAAECVERIGKTLWQQGKFETLHDYVRALPRAVVREKPWLILYGGTARGFNGDREEPGSLYEAYLSLKRKGDRNGELFSLAQLLDGSIFAGVCPAPRRKLIEEAESLLESGTGDDSLREENMLWNSVGLARIVGGEGIRKGIRACQHAFMLSRRSRDVNVQAYSLFFTGLGFLSLGEFPAAAKACGELEKAVQRNYSAEIRVLPLALAGLLAARRGDFMKSQSLLDRLQGEIERIGFTPLAPLWYEISGHQKLSRKEWLEAEEIGSQYVNTAVSLRSAVFLAAARRFQALVEFRRGNHEKAKMKIRESMATPDPAGPSKFGAQRSRLLMGLIRHAMGDASGAREDLKEALAYFETISAADSEAECRLAMALAEGGCGKREAAASHLRHGFRICEAKEYEAFPFLGDEGLAEACLLAVELDVREAQEYVTRLLVARDFADAASGLARLERHRRGEVREKALEIRKRIYRSRLPRLRIETLGEFRVFRGETPMEESEWDRNQPKRLLKALLSHGSRAPREMLIEDLWPEEKQAAGEKNFKTTLQRLRKSLEPGMTREFNSSYVHLQHNTVFLDPDLCRSDVDLFLYLAREGADREKKKDPKGALSLYAEAVETYRGDFLRDVVYDTWAEMRREELKRKYVEILGRAGKLSESQGALGKAVEYCKKTISADPLLEEAYQHLMSLYLNKGMLNEAIKTYEACKKVLASELNARPDPLTESLRKKILEQFRTDRSPAGKPPEASAPPTGTHQYS